MKRHLTKVEHKNLTKKIKKTITRTAIRITMRTSVKGRGVVLYCTCGLNESSS